MLIGDIALATARAAALASRVVIPKKRKRALMKEKAPEKRKSSAKKKGKAEPTVVPVPAGDSLKEIYEHGMASGVRLGIEPINRFECHRSLGQYPALPR